MQARTKALIQGLLILGLVLAMVAGVAAQDNGSPRLRVMHAAPGAPPADVYIDGNLIFPNVPFKGISDYIILSPGNHTIRVTPAGQRDNVILEPTLPLVEGRDYTLLAVGRPGSIEAWQLTDSNDAPGSGRARVRLVHASPDAPAVDVCLAGQDNCPITNLTFKNASDYETLDAGTYNLDIRRSGTNEVLRNLPDLRLNGGTIYSLFLTGLWQGDPPLQLVARPDAGRGPTQPPVTGAFLSPMAMVVVLSAMVVLGGGVWVARRRLSRW